MSKLQKLLIAMIAISMIIVYLYFSNHYTNKEITEKFHHHIGDSLWLKEVVYLVGLHADSGYDKLRIDYRIGWPNIMVEKVDIRNKYYRSATINYSSPFQAAFFGKSGFGLSLVKNKYVRFEFPYPNYRLHQSWIYYFYDAATLISFEKNLKAKHEKAFTEKASENWLLVVK